MNSLRLTLCLLVFSAFSAQAQFRGQSIEHTLEWHRDFAPALAEAEETGRPILLVFR